MECLYLQLKRYGIPIILMIEHLYNIIYIYASWLSQMVNYS